MNLEEYQKEVKRTDLTNDKGVEESIKMALFGLQDELGEVAGPLKKWLWHGHDLDMHDIIDEMGDVFWYYAALANALGLSLNLILQKNVEKLQKRYPDGFSQEKSKNRVGEE